MLQEFSSREAAALLRQDARQLRQEFTRVIDRSAQSGRRKRRRLAFRDMLYFTVVAALQDEGVLIQPEARLRLYGVLRPRVRELGEWSRRGHQLRRAGRAPLTIDMEPVMEQLRRDVRAYNSGRRRVVSQSDVLNGQPVFKGTRIPVRHIVDQFRRGVPREEIVEDYPSLDDDALFYAELEARMGQGPGRPRKESTHSP